MGLFGRRSGRADARPTLAGAGGGGVGEWPRAYEGQMREGFAANPVAQRAVRLVAEGLGSAPIEGGPDALVALVTAHPGGVPLLETLAAHLLLHGNAYVQPVGDGAGGVAALYPLRPERMSVEAGPDGWPAAYRYRVGSSVTRLPADGEARAVIHLRSFHPADDHHGLGCLSAAAGAIAIHNAATRWNKALLDNAARPSGALVYDPGDGSAMSGEQFRRLQAEMEGAYAGAANAGRPMLLEGGLKWQAMSLTPADMDFVGLKATAAREIALAFGVPPMLLGLPGDAAYANYREANRALWRLGILPLAGAILGGITAGLAERFEGARLAVALDRVPALAEDRERLWRSVGAATFLSDAEKRRVLGLEVPA